VREALREELLARMQGDGDRRSLSRAWHGQRALRGLGALVARAAPRLEIDARRVEHPDAFTGAALREAVDRHLAADRGHTVTLREPVIPEALSMLGDLVGTLPRHARWAGDQQRPLRERRVLLPATRVTDDETAALLAYWLTVVAGPLRLPNSEARLLAAAAAAFADNSLRYRPADGPPALMCACHDPESHDLQIVCLSPNVPSAAARAPATFIRALDNHSRENLGGLHSLTQLAERRGIDATLRVATGTARFFLRSGMARFDAAAPRLPAFVVSLEVHLR
jgi:hypothetical protein